MTPNNSDEQNDQIRNGDNLDLSTARGRPERGYVA